MKYARSSSCYCFITVKEKQKLEKSSTSKSLIVSLGFRKNTCEKFGLAPEEHSAIEVLKYNKPEWVHITCELRV